MNASVDTPLQLAPEPIAALRADLHSAQFSVGAVEQLLGSMASAALRRTQLLPARGAVQNNLDEPLAALAGLFLLGLPVTNAQLRTALPTLGAAGAAQLGLVERQGEAPQDHVRALIDLRPYSAQDGRGEVAWWIASDLGEEVVAGALPPHHVLGVGGAAKTLAGLTVRETAGRALDLGTGSGIQALHLSRHCGEVVGTDISRRALTYARFNFALNQINPTPQLRQGSLLEPVVGEKFDLVVSNPPFVITPPNSGLPQYEYRDVSQRGDQLIENLVTDLGAHLNPGGIAQFLGNWEHRGDQEWDARLGDWLEAAAAAGHNLDAWIVEREVQDPAEYAELWLQDGGADPRRDAAGYEWAYRAWLDDFASRDVEQIGFGYILLRHATGVRPTLRRIEHVETSGSNALGGHISSVLHGVDQLTGLSEAEILARHFVCPPDVTEERYGSPGAADPALIYLRQGGGYGRSVRVSTWQSAFIGACDGELSAAQICGALAHLGQLPVAEIIAEVVPFIELALWGGFLQPGAQEGE